MTNKIKDKVAHTGPVVASRGSWFGQAAIWSFLASLL